MKHLPGAIMGADDDLWIREPDVWRYHAGWVNRPTRFETWTHPI